MMPLHRHMNSYPHQTSTQGYHCPGHGNNPHQMRMGSPTPVPCGYWPNSGGPGFPVPCYGCCIHGNYNGFSPYYLPQAPHHPCCGSYCGFHPVHHTPPYYIPPQYPADHQPMFEYDKDVARNRYCSECPNHVYDTGNSNSVRIEEQEPEIKKESSGKAVVPAQSTGFPYPIIWVPQESVREQEHRRPLGSKSPTPAEEKAPKNTKVPKRNSWFPLDSDTLRSLLQNQDRKNMENCQKVVFPFDIDKLKSLLQGRDEEEAENQWNGAQSGHPIFWIPSLGKSQEDKRKGDTEDVQKLTKEGFPVLKFFPFNLKANGDQSVKPEAKEGDLEHSVNSDMEEKHTLHKSTPVKQSEDRVQNFQEPALSSKKEEQNTLHRTIPVKLSEDQGQKSTEQEKRVAENKPGDIIMRKQSSSPSKTSKLPPVCLRVDPLPKKKNGNGSPRSPSPPTRKGESSASPPTRKGESSEMVKDNTKLPASPRSNKEEPDKLGTKTIPVLRDVQCEDASKRRTMSETRPNVVGSEKERTEIEANLEKEAKKVQSTLDKEPAKVAEAARSDETAENRQKPVKKTFSIEEAATVIQSGYRGYEVRRWEPLRKLKQMAKIREQMLDVKSRIQAIEGSTDHRNNEKETAVVGEMVMSLLLKLDAIQGLHPSVRDIRKSLAKELLGLQEKLDSLKKSKAMMEDVSIVEQVETPGEAVKDKTSSQTSEDQVEPRHGLLAEGLEKVSVPIIEESAVPLPSSVESVMTTKNETNEQLAAEKEEERRLVEIALPGEEEPTAPTTKTHEETGRCDTDAANAEISKETEEGNSTAKTVVSINPQSADEKEATVTTSEKEEVVEGSLELMKELKQHVDGNEDRTPERDEDRDAEAEANVLEETNGMAEECNSLPLEENLELLELPIGVIDEEQQDHSRSEVQESSPCTLEASVDTFEKQQLPQLTEIGEPVMVSSDSAPNTEVDQRKEEETTNTNKDTTVKGGGNFIQVDCLQEMPENIHSTSETAGSTAAEPEEPCQETNMGKDADHLESIEHNDQEAEKSQYGLAEHDVVVDAETAKTQVEAGGSPESSSPTGTAVADDKTRERNKKLMEENQRLRETMEKLMEAGREQLDVISSLTGRVKSLEKKLSQRKKMQAGRRRPYCGKLMKNSSRTKAPTAAVM